MEPFFDGGLFEIIIAIAFGYAVNYIFIRKYLLVLFSALVIFSPVALLFIKGLEFQHWLIGICLVNSVLFVAVLWNVRKRSPNRTLFNLEDIKNKLVYKNKILKKDIN